MGLEEWAASVEAAGPEGRLAGAAGAVAPGVSHLVPLWEEVLEVDQRQATNKQDEGSVYQCCILKIQI